MGLSRAARITLLAALVACTEDEGSEERRPDAVARPDARGADATAPDAGGPDARRPDGSSLPDAARMTDASRPDARAPDAGAPGDEIVGVKPPPRRAHTSTLLDDGRVLIVGGTGAAESPEQSWLFDPTTNRFSRGPDLDPGLSGHSATKLPGGKVLIAGGLDGFGTNATTVDTALLFDPATDTFETTGSMTGPRFAHRAFLLENGPDAGKVLVIAGAKRPPVGDERILPLEVYDPATGEFALLGTSLPIQRDGANYTVLADGRILIAGGATRSGGRDYVDTALIYDPSTRQLEDVMDTMAFLRANQSSILQPDGEVFLFGGGNRTTSMIEETDIYDPSTDTFRDGPDWTDFVSSHRMVPLDDGRVLQMGGTSVSGVRDDVIIWDAATLETTLHPRKLSRGLFSFTATILQDGRILLVGGQGQGSIVVGEAELFLP